MKDEFYVGSECNLEFTVTDPRTRLPVEPESATVTVQPPDKQTEPFPVTATPVTGKPGVFKAAPIENTEAGEWLAIVNTTPPYKDCKPHRWTVKDPTTQ